MLAGIGQDADGLPYGTDPRSADTDHDGRSDLYEAIRLRSPIVPDVAAVGVLGGHLAKASDNRLWIWGGNGYGQGGFGHDLDQATPFPAFDARAVKNPAFPVSAWDLLSAGYAHSMALNLDGTLWVAGSNNQTELGIGAGTFDTCRNPLAIGTACSKAFRNVPHPDPRGTSGKWSAVAAGNEYSLAIDEKAGLWSWGSNDSGQLGLGDTSPRNIPTRIDELGPLAVTMSIAASPSLGFSMAISASGRLFTWGSNLATGSGVIAAPIEVNAETDWVAISAGRYALALKSDGSIYSWGSNVSGRTGLGLDAGFTSTPTEIGCCYKAIAAAYASGFAIKTDGTLWAWGDNSFGQLGLGDKTQRLVPTKVGLDSDWVAVAGSQRNATGIKADGSYLTWGGQRMIGFGSDVSFMLGLGDNFERLVPTRMPRFGP